MVNTNIVHYVLRSRVDEKVQIKLLVAWVRLYAVIAALPYTVFKLKHLVTGDDLEVHASRLKLFADKDLDVTAELVEHVVAQGAMLRVRELLQHRWNAQTQGCKILVG
ncbi:hypothetical protein PC128_g13605 [Phytophthora cactorum]|nr:hypothetical protein PC128_g13605 [Phytophthora cactorum]